MTSTSASSSPTVTPDAQACASVEGSERYLTQMAPHVDVLRDPNATPAAIEEARLAIRQYFEVGVSLLRPAGDRATIPELKAAIADVVAAFVEGGRMSSPYGDASVAECSPCLRRTTRTTPPATGPSALAHRISKSSDSRH